MIKIIGWVKSLKNISKNISVNDNEIEIIKSNKRMSNQWKIFKLN